MNVIKSGSLLPVVHWSIILKIAYPEEIFDARKVTLSDASRAMMLVVTGGTYRDATTMYSKPMAVSVQTQINAYEAWH